MTPVIPKKLFGKAAHEIFQQRSDEDQHHSKAHGTNAFCGSAGPEELKHLNYLLDKLTDNEILELAERVGIRIAAGADEREMLGGVLIEADREIFYREYHKIIKGRND